MRADTMLPLVLEGLDVERAHWTEQHGSDDWSVWFYPDLVVLDVRGLEPPEPMVRVLKTLDRLAPGQRLEPTSLNTCGAKRWCRRSP